MEDIGEILFSMFYTGFGIYARAIKYSGISLVTLLTRVTLHVKEIHL